MAIINRKRKNPYVVDNDNLVFVGIDLPFRRSDGVEGYFASTSTTFDSVRNDIVMLLNTNYGERLMQPSLGTNLKKYIFEPMTDDTQARIVNEIQISVKKWLPFVIIRDIQITPDRVNNTWRIKIAYNLNRDQNTLQIVEVEIGE